MFIPNVTNVGCDVSLFPESLHERHFISVPDPVAEHMEKCREEINSQTVLLITAL